MITHDHIELVAKETLRWPDNRKWSSKDKERRIRSCFGAPGDIIADIWNRIEADGDLQDGARPKHLLWALVFLKVYSTEEIHCSIVAWPSAKTFQNGLGTLSKGFQY